MDSVGERGCSIKVLSTEKFARIIWGGEGDVRTLQGNGIEKIGKTPGEKPKGLSVITRGKGEGEHLSPTNHTGYGGDFSFHPYKEEVLASECAEAMSKRKQ